MEDETIENAQDELSGEEVQGDAGSDIVDTGEDVQGDADSATEVPDATIDQPEIPDEVSGLRQARDANAEKARKAAEEAAYWRGVVEANFSRKAEESEEDYDPEEPVTRADFERMRQQDTLKQQQALRDQQINASFIAAREKYKNDSILTFEQAEAKARDLLASGQWTKGTLDAMGGTPNPAETLRNMVMAQTDILQKVQTTAKKQAVEQTVESLNRNTNQAGTLSDAPGGNRVVSEAKRWQDMPTDELLAEADRVMRGG